mgnify:CR=1 FL=1
MNPATPTSPTISFGDSGLRLAMPDRNLKESRCVLQRDFYVVHSLYLFSKKAKKHFCGYMPGELQGRLRRHNTNHRGFTGPYEDWTCIWRSSFTDKADAMKLERRIKIEE